MPARFRAVLHATHFAAERDTDTCTDVYDLAFDGVGRSSRSMSVLLHAAFAGRPAGVKENDELIVGQAQQSVFLAQADAIL